MIPYIPHTANEREQMLKAIGVASIDELFTAIPKELLLKGELPIAAGLSEEEVFQHLKELANLNQSKISFLGMGSYERIIPAAVQSLASLPAFVTAYTPYQGEISQGLLQAIFEYQSMICNLTSLDVSNASLYDGHTAASEAATIMLNSKRKSTTILVSETLHPFTLEVLRTWTFGTETIIKIIPEKNRVFPTEEIEQYLTAEVAGLIVQSPNRYGIIEDYTNLASKVQANNSLLTISSDPLSLVLQRSQGEWRADIAIGDTQPLGLPSAFGGPACGYIAVKEALMRKIPGRVVGETVDRDGERAFVLTLQAREQHIKRGRATSNICSNQALAALTTATYIALVGHAGMVEVANQSYDKAHYLADKLNTIEGVETERSHPFWCEFPLTLSSPEVMEEVLSALSKEGIFGGVRLYPLTKREEDKSTLIVAVTEKRTIKELYLYFETVREVLT